MKYITTHNCDRFIIRWKNLYCTHLYALQYYENDLYSNTTSWKFMRISHEQQELYLDIPVRHFNLISVLPHTESGVAKKYHVEI